MAFLVINGKNLNINGGSPSQNEPVITGFGKIILGNKNDNRAGALIWENSNGIKKSACMSCDTACSGSCERGCSGGCAGSNCSYCIGCSGGCGPCYDCGSGCTGRCRNLCNGTCGFDCGYSCYVNCHYMVV